MKINEIMKDSKIKIHASLNGHGILLITKAMVGVRDGLLVDSLTYFGADMEFREPSRIVAVNKRDGRTYEFEAQSIGPVTTKYGHFHLIRCTEDIDAVNRRRSERYDIDRLGVIKINKGDIRNALVYDISMRGIAFILDSEAKCRLGDKITASFRYDPDYFHFYACEATVVRAFTIDSQIAIGCTIDSMGADLISLIGSKKKEKNGLNVAEVLPVSKSPDEDIAKGKKIPVNYVPPLPKTELLSPEEAADLIPDRKDADIIKSRAEKVADMDKLSVIDRQLNAMDYNDELSAIEDKETSRQDLDELSSIEDRTPASYQKASMPSNGSSSPSSDYEKELSSIKERASKTITVDSSASSDKKSTGQPSYVHYGKVSELYANSPKPAAANLGLDAFDRYFNQNGKAVDERLFAARKDDGFLTPEQIADIIELEHIHNG